MSLGEGVAAVADAGALHDPLRLRRGWTILVLIALLASACAVLLLTGRVVIPWDGPLARGVNGRTTTGLGLADGEVGTVGAVLAPVGAEMTLVTVEPQGVKGVDLVGLVVASAERGAVGSARPFPPAGVEGARAPAGYEVAANERVQVLVGVTPGNGKGRGGYRSLLVTYRYRGLTYSDELPYGMTLCRVTCAPGP